MYMLPLSACVLKSSMVGQSGLRAGRGGGGGAEQHVPLPPNPPKSPGVPPSLPFPPPRPPPAPAAPRQPPAPHTRTPGTCCSVPMFGAPARPLRSVNAHLAWPIRPSWLLTMLTSLPHPNAPTRAPGVANQVLPHDDDGDPRGAHVLLRARVDERVLADVHRLAQEVAAHVGNQGHLPHLRAGAGGRRGTALGKPPAASRPPASRSSPCERLFPF